MLESPSRIVVCVVCEILFILVQSDLSPFSSPSSSSLSTSTCLLPPGGGALSVKEELGYFIDLQEKLAFPAA